MRVGSLFSGCGGMDLGLEKSGMECVWQVEKMSFALKILTRHWPKVPKHTDISTFCVEDGHVKIIQSLAKEKDMLEKKAGYSKSFVECCEYLVHAGLLQRMFQDFYPLMPEKTFARCSPSCKTSGMAFRGEYLIVNTLESPNNVAVSSLSDILESHVLQKFYLKPKAIEGIIRRSKKWGRSGYVFLQEMVNGKTQVRKTLSLQQLEQLTHIEQTPEQDEIRLFLLPLELIFEEPPINSTQKPSSPIQSRKKKRNSIQGQQEENEIFSPQQSELKKLAIEFKGISLRRLTPTEKERLQGFPINWTLPEESLLEMPLQ